MPQVDLETLVSVCGGGSCDRKIACETLAQDDPPQEEHDVPEVPPDFPPESFWLSKDAEMDWFDRNAFYERKESTKGNSNSTNLNPNLNPSSNSSSQRFSLSLKSKASIIGLPKPQKSCFTDAKLRRNYKPANIRFFPKRAEPAGKSTVPMTEPSSPKVSCMGRVRSKKDRNRRLRSRQRSLRSSEPAMEKTKPTERRRAGLWTSFRSIFRSGCRHQPAVEIEEPSTESPPRKSVTSKARDVTEIEPAGDPPGLGGMMRFASGRRSESWDVGESDRQSVNMNATEPSDRDSVFRR
ncbi:hypothetical protein L1049_007991 [Liquidambar formosana]|uniref:Uncharacterized protein n=1 Tax=Liquidambar formosana TaxID=63359 RepID=A0AAP0S955_LIQFO